MPYWLKEFSTGYTVSTTDLIKNGPPGVQIRFPKLIRESSPCRARARTTA